MSERASEIFIVYRFIVAFFARARVRALVTRMRRYYACAILFSLEFYRIGFSRRRARERERERENRRAFLEPLYGNGARWRRAYELRIYRRGRAAMLKSGLHKDEG